MSDTIDGGVGSNKPDRFKSTDSKAREGHTKEKVILNVVYGLLKEKSSKWDDIGEALGISLNDRQIIRKDDNCIKLEAVLNKWIESECSDVSWSHLIKTLKELKLCDLADKVRKYLYDDNHQDGSTSIDENTIPHRNEAILQNPVQGMVSKSNSSLVYTQVTVTQTRNIMENGHLPGQNHYGLSDDLADMPPQRFLTQKETSYKEDKPPTETTNIQTDATSTMATDYDVKPVDVNDTGSTPQLVISADGRDTNSTFQQASSHINPTSHAGQQESHETNTIRLLSNGNGKSIPDVYKSRSSPPDYNELIGKVQDDKNKEIDELKQKVRKYEDERESFFQREKQKLEQDRKILEINEEKFEERKNRLYESIHEREKTLEDDRKRMHDEREEEEIRFNSKRRSSEIELQAEKEKQKTEFEKQLKLASEKLEKENQEIKQKMEKEMKHIWTEKMKKLNSWKARLNDEENALNEQKQKLDKQQWELKEEEKLQRERKLDELKVIKKKKERVDESSHKVKGMWEGYWAEHTILQQTKKDIDRAEAKLKEEKQNETKKYKYVIVFLFVLWCITILVFISILYFNDYNYIYF